VALCIIALSISTSNALADDLISIYREAMANDATIASSLAQLEAAREKIPQAKALLLPNISGQAQAQRQHTETDITGDNGTSTKRSTSPRSISISLTQPIYRPAVWENYAQSKLSVSQAQYQYSAAQQDLILRVSQAYFDILTVQDALKALAVQKTAISEQLASAKRNFEVGTATITDQQEAQSRYDLVIAQEIAGKNDLLTKQAALQNIIGRTAPPLAALKPDAQLQAPLPAKVEDWVSSAEENNYQVQFNTLAKEIAQREITKSKVGHLPTVDFTTLVSKAQQSTFSGGNQVNADIRTGTIGIAVAIPLYAGGGVSSRVRETENLLTKAEKDLEASRRAAAFSARQSFSGVESGLAQVKALEAAERSSKLALESNKVGYAVGVRINIDVLNAQQQLASTQRDLSKSKYDTLVNALKLKSAAGSLREEDLAQINESLQDPLIKK
jgi:outer membrane protein